MDDSRGMAAKAAVRLLSEAGVGAVFGNPGTTELPLMHALAETPELPFYLALHEGVAVGMAAGYAVLSGRAGVVLLHVMPGVAHGLNNYYNAARNGLPVVVIAGQQDRRHQILDPVLYGDLQALLAPLSKWSWEARTAEEVPEMIRRGLDVALSPPRGPVFLGIPLDLQLAEIHVPEYPAKPLGARLGPAAEGAVAAAAELLVAARSPAVVAGDVIGMSGAGPALVDLAETLALAAYWEPMPMLANFPNTHPLFQGLLLPSGEDFRKVFQQHDVVLVCGMGMRAPVLYSGLSWADARSKAVLLTDDPRTVEKGLHTACDLLGDPSQTLLALGKRARALLSGGQEATAIAARRRQLSEQSGSQRQRLHEAARKRMDSRPLAPQAVVQAVMQTLPAGALVADEAVSSSAWVALYGMYDSASDYLGPSKGGGLGFGLPAALGAQVAVPNRSVVAFLGEGAAQYAIQGLWTAAHHRLPVVFCILNNASYRILKGGMLSILGVSAEQAELTPGMNLRDPEPDLVACARSYGLNSARAATIEECVAAVRTALASGEPWLIDIPVERAVRAVFR